MYDIRHLVRIAAPRERAYRALTTSEGVRAWWTRDADLEPWVDGIGEMRFPRYGERAVIRIWVDALEPPERVRWRVASAFHPQWRRTTVAFDLRADGAQTVLSFAHRGFAEADEAYALFNTGWAYYLLRLQQHLERGVGAPSPELDFARVVA